MEDGTDDFFRPSTSTLARFDLEVENATPFRRSWSLPFRSGLLQIDEGVELRRTERDGRSKEQGEAKGTKTKTQTSKTERDKKGTRARLKRPRKRGINRARLDGRGVEDDGSSDDWEDDDDDDDDDVDEDDRRAFASGWCVLPVPSTKDLGTLLLVEGVEVSTPVRSTRRWVPFLLLREDGRYVGKATHSLVAVDAPRPPGLAPWIAWDSDTADATGVCNRRCPRRSETTNLTEAKNEERFFGSDLYSVVSRLAGSERFDGTAFDRWDELVSPHVDPILPAGERTGTIFDCLLNRVERSPLVYTSTPLFLCLYDPGRLCDRREDDGDGDRGDGGVRLHGFHARPDNEDDRRRRPKKERDYDEDEEDTAILYLEGRVVDAFKALDHGSDSLPPSAKSSRLPEVHRPTRTDREGVSAWNSIRSILEETVDPDEWFRNKEMVFEKSSFLEGSQ